MREEAGQGSSPVGVLREQVTALEAAMALVLREPEKKAVHALRKGTRRLEAQLELLSVLAEEDERMRIPAQGGRKVAKLLGSLRKEAGRVRDLDVQEDLAREAAEGKGDVAEAGDAEAGDAEADAGKKLSKEAKQLSKEAKQRSREAKQLRRALKKQRGGEAKTLVTMLKRHSLKVGPKLEAMLKDLEPAAEVKVADQRLEEVTRRWYAERVRGLGTDEDGLHGVRKAAKLARYLAEGGEGLDQLAKSFEELQELGGEWHDLLTMQEVARALLGKKAKLARAFGEREASLRQEFLRMVQDRTV